MKNKNLIKSLSSYNGWLKYCNSFNLKNKIISIMYKKFSDSEISNYVDLGNETWEFCFNITSGITIDNLNNTARTEWSADCILVDDITNYKSIFQCLIRDKYSISDEFDLINNYLYDNNVYKSVYDLYQCDRILYKKAATIFLESNT